MSKKRIMRAFKIEEISLVDSPAQIGAFVNLRKRNEEEEEEKEPMTKTTEEIDLAPLVKAIQTVYGCPPRDAEYAADMALDGDANALAKVAAPAVVAQMMAQVSRQRDRVIDAHVNQLVALGTVTKQRGGRQVEHKLSRCDAMRKLRESQPELFE